MTVGVGVNGTIVGGGSGMGGVMVGGCVVGCAVMTGALVTVGVVAVGIAGGNADVAMTNSGAAGAGAGAGSGAIVFVTGARNDDRVLVGASVGLSSASRVIAPRLVIDSMT